MTEPAAPASLTAAVLAEEAARQRSQRDAGRDPLGADHALAGVGDEATTMKAGLTRGGAATFVVLLLLNSLDELEAAALTVLAPDVRDALGVSDGTIVFLMAASAAFLVLGAMPLGWLADRCRRAPIVAWAGLVFSAMVFLSGLAVNAFMLFWARLGAGIAKASTLPVHSSLLADTYPIGVRGRVAATNVMAGRVVVASSPLVVGGLAEVFDWRVALVVLAVPVAAVAVAAFRLGEPPRGQWERRSLLSRSIDEDEDDDDGARVTVEAAFGRLRGIRTMRTASLGLAAVGFTIFTVPVLGSLHLEDELGATAFERGLATSIGGFAAVAVLPFVGRHFDALYRTDPTRTLRLLGLVVFPAAVLVPLQFAMPNLVAFAVVGAAPIVLGAAAFAMVQPLVWSLAPHRHRGLAVALLTAHVFLLGAVGGSLAAAWLADSHSVRTAAVVLAVPANLAGGLAFLRGSRSVRGDLALVAAEIHDEAAEHLRRTTDTDDVPVLEVDGVDFSYGPVQVLFDVTLHVASGETLAVLGPNGAGKSTLLRVIAGLATPDGGTVRLDGRAITFSPPHQRGALGIELLPGGGGIFGSMTVRDNLVIGSYRCRSDPREVDRRIARVLDLFPALTPRLDQAAGDLSGGQQQMLALARVMLHQPRLLVIDELSLGLAPMLVSDLLGTIEGLKAAGQTMIVVEQSLNVALAIADRAVFLEKGQVRLEGPARELAGRDDLARATLLGTSGLPWIDGG